MTEPRLVYALHKKDIVIDTGALLIHALGAFERGKYLPLACGFLHEKDREKVSRELFAIVDRLLSASVAKFITPHALTEFFNILEKKLAQRKRRLSEFYPVYQEVLIKLSDIQPAKNELLTHEQLLKMGIADISAILASDMKDAIIISTDNKLVQWCKKNQRDAFHLYYDLYLTSLP